MILQAEGYQTVRIAQGAALMPAENVFLRYATADQWRQLYDPDRTHDWLGPDERRTLDGLRDARRRAAWLAARLVAKQLIQRLALSRRRTARRSIPLGWRFPAATAAHRRFSPQCALDGRRLPLNLSIAHTDRAVLVGLATAPDVRVGVDLVAPQRYGLGFVRLWFTPAERDWLARAADPRWIAAVWAVKECVYKATNCGEPFRPQSIEVSPQPGGGFRVFVAGLPLPCGAPCVRHTRQGELVALVAYRSALAGDNDD